MIEEKKIDLKENFDIPQMNNLYQSLFLRGKALRSVLTKEVANHLNISKEKSDKLSNIVEYIHQSSILHDDVIDASPVRRGSLSIWMQYSMKKSILAGDYLLAKASSDTADMDNVPLVKFTAETLKKLIKGEWLQDSLKNQETIDGLKKVHELKTASLFQWSVQAPFLVANFYKKDLHKCLSRIGLFMGFLFQRADDLLDFDIRNKEKKIVFKDMEEGYLNSFSVYLCENTKKEIKTFLKKCRSLKEVKTLLGEDNFKKWADGFDKENQMIINHCQEEIDNLRVFEINQSFITMLKKWPSKLYWRKSV